MKINWNDLTDKLIELRNGERFLVSKVVVNTNHNQLFIASVCRFIIYDDNGRLNREFKKDWDIVNILDFKGLK